MSTQLVDKSITQLSQALQAGDISLTDLIQEVYANIEAHADQLNIFTHIRDKQQVLSEAEKKQKQLSKNSSPLLGMPYIIKDSYVTQGIPTTASSDVLKNFTPPYNATVVNKLEQAGAILIAKCNMDAWGHGASTDNTDFGPAKNPYDTTRSPGGSTGGAAAAIAARMAVFGIGEDTGGSIRNPSSHNNISGLKVTYGRVSRYGCIAYASSFDTVGPMAKTAQDCALVLEIIAGADPYDATSSPESVDSYAQRISTPPSALSIAIPSEMLPDQLDADISKTIDSTISQLESLGHTVSTISIPELEYSLSVYNLIGPSETSSNLGRYDGVRYGQGRSHFTPETMRRILTGTYALSAGYYDQYYRKAQKVRTLLINAFETAFDAHDVLLMPVNPTPPPKIGELIADPVTNILADIFTTTHNIVGIPSLSLPAGFSDNDLPIGIQISAPKFQESLLFQLGYQYQQHTTYHQQKPALLNQNTEGEQS